MTIAPVDSSEDLNALVEELGEHTEVESMGVGEESDDEGEECVHEGVGKSGFVSHTKTHSGSNKYGSIPFMIDSMHYVNFRI